MKSGKGQAGSVREREGESPRVSGQPTPQDALDGMGGGRFEGAKVNRWPRRSAALQPKQPLYSGVIVEGGRREAFVNVKVNGAE